MSTATTDTRAEATLLINAFIEALVGLFALRLDPVKDVVRTHAPEMTVMSSYDGEHVNLAARAIVDGVSTSGPEILSAVDQTTRAFVAAMWGLLTTHARYPQVATEPEIQFLRHLRNACGHNGRWNFTELKHLASWRTKSLALTDSGQLVFGGVLKHGDVTLLFMDIDRKYFV
jgi:hypothetical protein